MATTVEITQLIEDVNALTLAFDSNKFVVNARAAVQEGLEEFAVDDETKGQLYVQFEQQITASIVREVLEAGKNIQLIAAEKSLKLEQVKLVTAQIATEAAEQALKAQQTALALAQTTTEAADQTLKGSQNALLVKQALTEINEATLKANQGALVLAQTVTEAAEAKNKLAEEALKLEQVKLVTEQTATEKLRQNDTKASINVKNQSAKATWESARAEEARRLTMIKTNQDNNVLRKADYEVRALDAIGTSGVIIGAEHMVQVNTAIGAIDTVQMSYITAHLTVPEVIPTTVV